MDDLPKMQLDKWNRRISTQIVACFDLIISIFSISAVFKFSWDLTLLFDKVTNELPQPDNLSPQQMTIYSLAVPQWSILSSNFFFKSISSLVPFVILTVFTWVLIWDAILLLEATKTNCSKDKTHPLALFENHSMAINKADRWRKDNMKMIFFVFAVILATWQKQTCNILALELGFVLWRLTFLYIVHQFISGLQNSGLLSGAGVANVENIKKARTVITV